MKGAILLSLLTAVITFSCAWSNFLDDDLDSWRVDRRSTCTGQSGMCYTSDQCCKGFVCAAYDDLFGKNPEIPGECVREKDLRRCRHQSECEIGAKCSPLGHKQKLYCIYEDEAGSVHPKKPINSQGGSLGAYCKDNLDCKTETNRGDPMCCVLVKRYRQKPKQMCDRETPASNCITQRK